jgi:NAD+ synthase (glutamine-hydrolysing)
MLDQRGGILYHHFVDKLTEHGFIRLAMAVPRTTPADVDGNLKAMEDLYLEADRAGADLVLFPELAITGYTAGDLFFQDCLLEASSSALSRLADLSGNGRPLLVAGIPLAVDGVLYNTAVVFLDGKIIGAVPKTYLPSSGEFYEYRWFAGGDSLPTNQFKHNGKEIPLGADLLFQCGRRPGFRFGIEICEDLWSVTPPSGELALGGASVILNCSASNELAGKAAYRKNLVVQQSARCLAAYGYVSSGCGESTTDTVFGGHALVAENGWLTAEGERFSRDSHLTLADVDLLFLMHERVRSATFRQNRELFIKKQTRGFRIIPFDQKETAASRTLVRRYEPHPFIPGDIRTLEERCSEIFSIQSTGLAQRMLRIGAASAVIGLSGGLDSTLALLVIIEAFKRTGMSRDAIKGITMPGFGTTSRTLGNVEKLCRLTGVPLETIDIRGMCESQMKALCHSGEPADTAYENIQARLRTALLMNRANMCGGIVVGTGDLSELALGWCTYNGDHISMYGVNAGVPKTLVKFLVKYVAEHHFDAETARVLKDILDTPISPELLPPDREGKITQKTEEVIGPYELHDFFLYHAVRCGQSPKKVLFLAGNAFESKYEETEIRKWLLFFLKRFFSQQFKRSCLPDGPKVGTIALSPRADWRMPSDASSKLWVDF